MDVSHFAKLLTHLRKEKGVSQKSAAADLGISQSLLSHYEKGIRECGLEFLVKASDYYGVSIDFLLGKSCDKNGNTVFVDDIPESDKLAKTNRGLRAMMPTLNKKLICNSVSLIMDKLSELNDKNVTSDVSLYLNLAIYNVYRALYDTNENNPSELFGVSSELYPYASDASMKLALANLKREMPANHPSMILDMDSIKNSYPDSAASLINLLQSCENKLSKLK